MTRRLLYLLPLLAGAVVLAVVALSLTHTTAEAQCGSQASSCKNCHETQSKLPVNHDGTGWHESHAFGDFCANCHAGNVQSTDAAAAHTGLVAPLDDLQTNCAACHPSDTQDRAIVYAAALGITLGSGDTPSGGDTSGGPAATAPSPTLPAPTPTTIPVIAGSSDGVPGLIDYNQQYAETVQGRWPINWGNVILGVLIIAMAAGGGAFAYLNERKLARLAATAKSQPAAAAATAPAAAPLSAADLMPGLAQLDPRGLRALQAILREPERANALLLTLARLDPKLIEQVRRLDRRELTLLVALAEEK
ncbi:MAG: cytochrome c3 family protein [Anaerolineales bacterium]